MGRSVSCPDCDETLTSTFNQCYNSDHKSDPISPEIQKDINRCNPIIWIAVRNVKELIKARNDAILAKTRCQIDFNLKSVELDIMSPRNIYDAKFTTLFGHQCLLPGALSDGLCLHYCCGPTYTRYISPDMNNAMSKWSPGHSEALASIFRYLRNTRLSTKGH